MNYYPFPAQLRSNYNSINEYGLASISSDGTALDFYGEFIPLQPLGTEAVISWILGDKVLISFTGTVYLSSKNLLRLVSVNQAELDSIKPTFQINTNLPASISLFDSENDKSSATKAQSAELLYISLDTIKLRVSNYIGEKQIISLNADVEFLILRNLKLKVKKRVLLGRNNSLLICNVLPVTDENFISLSTYSARLEKLEENK